MSAALVIPLVVAAISIIVFLVLEARAATREPKRRDQEVAHLEGGRPRS